MALIVLKNNIDKYWNKIENNFCFNDQEKKQFLSKIFEFYQRISSQLELKYEKYIII